MQEIELALPAKWTADRVERAIDAAEENAMNAAAMNRNLDTDPAHGGTTHTRVDMVPDEDIEFGIWRPDTHTFELLDALDAGVDERREANAVRTWGRRVTSFTRTDSLGGTTEFDRNDGLKLVFAPVLGVMTGDVTTRAVAYIKGGKQGAGFVGLNSVKFNGTTKSDSYNAAAGNYPANPNLANKNSAIASNGDITLVGGAQIWGDVHPGVDGNVLPYPLGDNTQVTGYMDPLDQPLSYATPPFSPPEVVYPAGPGQITPIQAFDTNTLAFAPNQPHTDITIGPGNYKFSKWTTKSQQRIYADNRTGDLNIWINGDVTQAAQCEFHIIDNSHVVTFYVNGDFKMDGGGIFNDANLTTPNSAKPECLVINVTKANTTVSIGGSPMMAAHIMAPLSDVKIHGSSGQSTSGFFGWAVGKTLVVDGNMVAHYDESLTFPNEAFTVHLVQ